MPSRSKVTLGVPLEELLRNLSEAIESLTPPSVFLIAPLILGYVILVGPVGYVVLSRRKLLRWGLAVGSAVSCAFALGFLALLVLRLVAIGNVRGLVDLAVLATYISGFALFRFVSMMYSYGHELDPAAAFKVEPFTPAIFGTKQIANFTTASYPDWGSYWLGIFISLLLGTLLWHLIAGRREALRAEQFPPSLS